MLSTLRKILIPWTDDHHESHVDRHKELLQSVRKLELSTRRRVDGMFVGAYHSLFQGRGIEFTDVREYVPGDDIRSIDWNITARTQIPHVKEFIEERDLEICVLLDRSASTSFGSEKPQAHFMEETAAALFGAAVQSHDGFSLGLFTDRIEYFRRPGKGRRHMLACVSDMLSVQVQGKQTQLLSVLKDILIRVKRKTVLVILTDGQSPEFLELTSGKKGHRKEFTRLLRVLGKRHEVLWIFVEDAAHEKLPDVGLIALQDEESGEEIVVDTSDASFRNEYGKQVDSYRKIRSKIISDCGMREISINEGQHPIKELRRAFAKRANVHRHVPMQGSLKNMLRGQHGVDA